ncbi:MAG: nucleoside-diphosphate sugar epimerase/dehydratase [Planctomycetota bacterium]
MSSNKPPERILDSAQEPIESGFREFAVKHRLVLLVLLHTLLFVAIYWCAFLMRFSLAVPERYVSMFFASVLQVVALKLTVFYFMQSFHGWWRHVNFSDVISLAKSATIATLVLIAFDTFILPGQIPRIVIANDFFATIVIIGCLRSFWRVWDERIAPLDLTGVRQRALLFGGNVDAAKIAHLINGQHTLGVRVLGLVSKDPTAKGRRFSDLAVVGHMEVLPELMAQHRANSLFVIAGSVPAKQLRQLLDTASKHSFDVKILPTLNEQLRGMDRMPIREVSFNDLLRRKPATLDLGAIEGFVKGKVIMVTGAGGSIGSELCRQLARFEPSGIVLLGRGENRIFHIERELRELYPTGIELIPRIANITDKRRMTELFETHLPEVVFHAAAHKHVPLVELNVGESIVNNVHGTKVVADLASQYNVERFVLVSTDKAVNPTSMMGCTKQMAERYCQSLGSVSSTRFISTRFGNVLGSEGSVVPIFQKQIQKGGPITITDMRMTRYFMTIPEASQLVIQAAAMGSGGEIFVLEMGQPVKILDLAKDLIRLAGHPPDSIDIVEKGMRPGEKLFEELYYHNEESLPTSHDQILSSSSRIFSFEEVESQVNQLIDHAFSSPETIRELMHKFVPEFITKETASTLTGQLASKSSAEQ